MQTLQNSKNVAEPELSKVHHCLTETIGNTPIVRLNRYEKSIDAQAQLLAKLEYFNPMASIKDRPAFAMIQSLRQSECFTDQTEIIEATSGNNGVACAWLCAIFDIPLTIVIPEHMSIERQRLIKHFGASIVTTAKHLGTKGAIDKAEAMVKDNPNAVMLNQFSNCCNVDSHISTTAAEILRDTCNNVDVFVCGVGTGGTISGVGRHLKQIVPSCEVIAVEPASCPVLSKGEKGVHAIQGLSSGHVPDILDLSVVDAIETVTDDDALLYAKSIAQQEGIAVGISSGATLCVASRLAVKPEYAGKSIVVIFADTAERYYSTALFE